MSNNGSQFIGAAPQEKPPSSLVGPLIFGALTIGGLVWFAMFANKEIKEMNKELKR